MKPNSSLLRTLLVGGIAAVFAACGGGGGAGTASSAAPAATASPPAAATLEGPGSFVGTVTGFGSVFVNGVEFFTSSAQVRIDDSPAQESQLKIGQVVVVKGRLNADRRTGDATEISFKDIVEGPVTALNISAGTFVVLGQTVRVTDATMFDNSLSPATINGLATAGLMVQVSGFRNASGDIVATRIEPKLPGTEIEVRGAVAGLNTTSSTFTINALTVDYSAAVVSNGTLANGVSVEVKGGSVLANGALRARSVEVESRSNPANNDVGRVEGIITRFASATDFDVGSTRVTTTSSTTLQTNGVTLAANVKVEVEGRFNSSGVLVATKVEIRPSNGTRLTAVIDSVDTAANTVQMLGITVSFSSTTQVEDKSRSRVAPLRIAALHAGDYLEVRGFENAAGTAVVAVIAEREDPDNVVELRGRVRSAADPALNVLGRSIDLPQNIQLQDSNDATLTRAQFFAAATGKVVKLRGRPNGSVIVWERAEFEN